jgi:hypothetical protein
MGSYGTTQQEVEMTLYNIGNICLCGLTILMTLLYAVIFDTYMSLYHKDAWEHFLSIFRNYVI